MAVFEKTYYSPDNKKPIVFKTEYLHFNLPNVPREKMIVEIISGETVVPYHLYDYSLIYDKKNDRYYLPEEYRPGEFLMDCLNDFLKSFGNINIYVKKFESVKQEKYFSMFRRLSNYEQITTYKGITNDTYVDQPSLAGYHILKDRNKFVCCPLNVVNAFETYFNLPLCLRGGTVKGLGKMFIYQEQISETETLFKDIYAGVDIIIDYNDISIDENMNYIWNSEHWKRLSPAMKKYFHQYVQKYILKE